MNKPAPPTAALLTVEFPGLQGFPDGRDVAASGVGSLVCREQLVGHVVLSGFWMIEHTFDN